MPSACRQQARTVEYPMLPGTGLASRVTCRENQTLFPPQPPQPLPTHSSSSLCKPQHVPPVTCVLARAGSPSPAFPSPQVSTFTNPLQSQLVFFLHSSILDLHSPHHNSKNLIVFLFWFPFSYLEHFVTGLRVAMETQRAS